MDIDVLKKLAIYYTKGISGINILDGRNKGQLDFKDFGNPEENLKASAHWDVCVRNLKEDQIKLYLSSSGGMKVNQDLEKEKLNYTPLFFSPNAISLSNDLQIVLRFWGNAEQVHKTFDFVHATNYFTYKEGLVRNLLAVESILTKQLKYQGSCYPLTSIIRVKKFLKKGFNITAGELLKIMFQISSLDLNNPDVLEEQLIGVDIAYFGMVIEALRTKYESEPDFKLTSEYINTLIDRIFSEEEIN